MHDAFAGRRLSRILIPIALSLVLVFVGTVSLYMFPANGQLTEVFADSACGNPYNHPPAGTVIREGSTGDNVKWLQYELNKHNGAGLTVDGVAGPATVAAIKNFQQANGLSVDGAAGNATIGKIDALWHGSGTPTPPAVGNNAAALAKTILISDVSLAKQHVSGITDQAFAYLNIVDTANGLPAARSSYSDSPSRPKAPGGTVALDRRLLYAIIKLSEKYHDRGSPAIVISEIAGGCHVANSRHYAGLAVDICRIGGVSINANNFSAAFFNEFRNYAFKTLGAARVFDPLHDDTSKSHRGHIHIDWDGTAPPVTENEKDGSTEVAAQPPASATDINSIALTVASQRWTGKRLRPTAIANGGSKLAKDKDFTILSYGANTAIGKGSITIQGEGKYAGRKTISFTITPAKVKNIKVTTGKKQMRITWTKASSAQKITNYQMRYRIKSTGNWKTRTLSSATASQTVKSLVSGKYYSVQARNSKTVNGVKYYSPWVTAKITSKIG